LHGGIIYEGLNLLRYGKFTRKVRQNTVFLQVHTLSPYTSNSKLPQQTCLSATTRVSSNNRSYQPFRMGVGKCEGQLFSLRTVGCGDCKGISCSNSNLKNVKDTDMTEDM
jgi:hypothetical protein